MKIDVVLSIPRASEKAGLVMNKQPTITLWSVIESMQSKFEKQGIDAEVADATIMRRLRDSLRTRPQAGTFHLATIAIP